ncbi:MAG: thiol:disulfide interchange protein DsbA/DsbL [Pseudomonadota bacterium]
MLLVLLLSSLAAWAEAPQSPVEGVNYHVLGTKAPTVGAIEVAEFFGYFCPHCEALEPHLEGWLSRKPEDVTFIRVPATFNRPDVLMYAKTYYALQQIGALDKAHAAIFAAIHKNNQKLNSQQKMEAFLATRGVDVAAYREAMDSFEINLKLQQAMKLAKKYNISGVPSLVVDKHYKDGDARSWEEKLQIVDYLVEKSRQRRPAAPPVQAPASLQPQAAGAATPQ